MTKREERMAVLNETVESKVKEYNSAMLDAEFGIAQKLDDEITEAVNEYTGLVKLQCYEECAACEDPMLEAIKRLSFTTIGVKDEKVEDSELKVRRVIEREKQIDLMGLHKFIKDGIGKDKKWHYMIEKLNLLLTCQKAIDLGIDPTDINDSYNMSKIAKEYDLGKDPASKTNLLKTLTTIVHAMIGEEYKPVSHDVNFLLSVYSRKSRKALTVTCANHKYMRAYVAEICHRIVMGKRYEIDYKKIKNS